MNKVITVNNTETGSLKLEKMIDKCKVGYIYGKKKQSSLSVTKSNHFTNDYTYLPHLQNNKRNH